MSLRPSLRWAPPAERLEPLLAHLSGRSSPRIFCLACAQPLRTAEAKRGKPLPRGYRAASRASRGCSLAPRSCLFGLPGAYAINIGLSAHAGGGWPPRATTLFGARLLRDGWPRSGASLGPTAPARPACCRSGAFQLTCSSPSPLSGPPPRVGVPRACRRAARLARHTALLCWCRWSLRVGSLLCLRPRGRRPARLPWCIVCGIDPLRFD